MSDYVPGWTLVPALVAAALRTTGPILEIGVGWFSTPVLHEIACAQDRALLSVDDSPEWLATFQILATPLHFLQQINYSEALPDLALRRWGLVVVDHGVPQTRDADAALFAETASIVVLHDASVIRGGQFRYQTADTRYPPATTLASQTDPLEWALKWQTTK